jgi:hypothetical protein
VAVSLVPGGAGAQIECGYRAGWANLVHPSFDRCHDVRDRSRELNETVKEGSETMNYTKGILSAFAAIVIANTVCSWLFLSKAMANSTGTMATDVSGFLLISMGNLRSPLFWIIAGLLFWLFFAASRSKTILRVCFFWIPTLIVSTLTFAIAGLYTYLWIHFRNQ